ncbi:ExeA family protein [Thalassomonas sp. M1454]|uniref:ExeA family protein n=1 Tax=Thalassomonas sp. M1454 TaxID=2594477 RepID=UPI00117E740D|nr:AAA family ATPase [Thalassomonas sp. M1454]TRX57954.1 AAA family ATPase [Thalassomonas sp. M1454]
MYEEHYRINSKPFQLTPDPKFFFASDKHKQALSYLKYGLDQGEGFIVITGPIGTGKTTLAQSLLEYVANTNIEAIQIVVPNLSPLDLLITIAKEFSIPHQNKQKSELLTCIEARLIELSMQNKRALLLVDEAQNLPKDTIEELRMLSNFQKDNKPLLQSFLLGQEELKAIIQSPDLEQFRQRIIASCHLKPLSIKEIEQYITHRLTLVNMPNPNIFSIDCYPLIEKITLGIPRKINLLVDRILLSGFLNDQQQFSLTDVQLVIDEMADELSSPLQQTANEPESNNEQIATPAPQVVIPQRNKLLETMQTMDDFLQENIEQKIKMNRYLDKLIQQKNLTLAQLDTLDLANDTDNE